MKCKSTDVEKLVKRVEQVGQRLIDAQPREVVMRNITKRVVSLIRVEAKQDRDDDSGFNSRIGSPHRQVSESIVRTSGISSATSISSPLRQDMSDSEELRDGGEDEVAFKSSQQEQNARPPLLTLHTSYARLKGVPIQTSMWNLLQAKTSDISPLSTPSGAQSISAGTRDLKAEVIDGIGEIIDELVQVDEQIAAYALEHIHTNEIILTHSSSRTVQMFLLKAALKRKFTVIHVESYPNDHEDTHATIMGLSSNADVEEDDETSTDSFQQTLTTAGITVILITDAAVFALMSRVNKVILAPHSVIGNGGLVAAAGARIIAKAAHEHSTPVMVLSGIYKLGPVYPQEYDSLIEYGDSSKIVSHEDGDLLSQVDLDNPLYDYVSPELVDLYITNT